MRTSHAELSWWVLALIAGCGASSAPPAHGPLDPDWPAWPPTETVACGAPLTPCAQGASLRVRWPARAPSDARMMLDGQEVEAQELELGVCTTPGEHVVRATAALGGGDLATRSGAITVEVVPGARTEVQLGPGANGVSLGAETTFVDVDLGTTVHALGEMELPRIAPDATPEERRVFAPELRSAFDAWRAQLTRVARFAEERGDAALHATASDHVRRAEAVGSTLEERPSADRLAAIQRAMQSEIDSAAEMVTVERSCSLWDHEMPSDALTPISVEARPYVTAETSVVRLRLAIDDVEILDTGDEAIESAQAIEGVATTGEHVVRVEATFALLDGAHRRIRRDVGVRISEEGARIRVRALGSETPVTSDEDLVVEIAARR